MTVRIMTYALRVAILFFVTSQLACSEVGSDFALDRDAFAEASSVGSGREASYVNWSAPYTIIYGGYSAKEGDGDWRLWEGNFNLVHHHLIGKGSEEQESIIRMARAHGVKLLVVVKVYDPKTGKLEMGAFNEFFREWGSEEAIFGYVYEAAYMIPREIQKRIYDNIKKVDPQRSVWCEFSSSDISTWREKFNPNACDALITYNYPYEKEYWYNELERILASVESIRSVVPTNMPIIPIVQAFEGGRWRLPPPGAIRNQIKVWLEAGPIVGVCFYRWRRSGRYKGIPYDDEPYIWEEVKMVLSRVRKSISVDHRLFGGIFENRDNLQD